MRARFWLTAVSMVAAAHVSGLTPPSRSDGPVRLLNCVVSPTGILQAEVDSTADAPMNCDITCGYEIGGKMFSHWFNETIPARFNGRVGEFDTSGARPGNFSGEMGSCKKTVTRG